MQAYRRGSNGNPVTSVDAPHAGAVEVGSLPHKPNFEKLLAWVKLRGMQALTKSGKPRKPRKLGKSSNRGPTTARQVARVGAMFLAKSVGNRYSKKGQKRFEDAAVQITQAISQGIEKHGTKPHWYVRECLEDIRQLLNTNMKAAKSGPAMRVKDSELF